MDLTNPFWSSKGAHDPDFERPPHPDRREPTGQGQRLFLLGFSFLVLLYSSAVLFLVAYMGDIGVRCILSPELKEEVPRSYKWTPEYPRKQDVLLAIDGEPIANYTDYVRAIRHLGN